MTTVTLWPACHGWGGAYFTSPTSRIRPLRVYRVEGASVADDVLAIVAAIRPLRYQVASIVTIDPAPRDLREKRLADFQIQAIRRVAEALGASLYETNQAEISMTIDLAGRDVLPPRYADEGARMIAEAAQVASRDNGRFGRLIVATNPVAQSNLDRLSALINEVGRGDI